MSPNFLPLYFHILNFFLAFFKNIYDISYTNSKFWLLTTLTFLPFLWNSVYTFTPASDASFPRLTGSVSPFLIGGLGTKSSPVLDVHDVRYGDINSILYKLIIWEVEVEVEVEALSRSLAVPPVCFLIFIYLFLLFYFYNLHTIFSCLVSRSSGWLGGALPPFSLPKAKDKDKWEDR